MEAKKAKDKLPDSLWETYSSFANSYGGVIIIGASENRDGSLRATGIENPEMCLSFIFECITN